jgi:hypothetical protein
MGCGDFWAILLCYFEYLIQEIKLDSSFGSHVGTDLEPKLFLLNTICTGTGTGIRTDTGPGTDTGIIGTGSGAGTGNLLQIVFNMNICLYSSCFKFLLKLNLLNLYYYLNYITCITCL